MGVRSATQWHILRSRHFVGVIVCDFSTVGNARQPLVTCCEHGHSAVGLETILAPCDALLKTLDTLVSDVCLREEVNDGDVGGELHVVPCFDSLNIHGLEVLCHNCGHYANCLPTHHPTTLFLVPLVTGVTLCAIIDGNTINVPALVGTRVISQVSSSP